VLQSETPGQVENLVSFAGYSVKSQNKYTFNDTVSIELTASTDTVDFCGEKLISFYLNGTTTLLLA